jgi:hypothetical protein
MRSGKLTESATTQGFRRYVTNGSVKPGGNTSSGFRVGLPDDSWVSSRFPRNFQMDAGFNFQARQAG